MKKILGAIILVMLIAVLIAIITLRYSVEPKADSAPRSAAVCKSPVELSEIIGAPEFEPLEIVDAAASPEPTLIISSDIPLSEDLVSALIDACDIYNIDYALALGLIETESTFNPDAYNPSGCYGLCQLNPAYFPANLSPAENIQYGIEYLSRQINVYGSIEAGLTAYNAGHDTGNRSYAYAVLSNAAHWEGAIVYE